jgi:GNAT superfamily N-acetyltransferase
MAQPQPQPQIAILPAASDDFVHLARLNYLGFSSAPANQLMFGQQSEDVQVANGQQYLKKCLDDPTCKFTKAVVDGKIVGFAQWHFYLEPMPVENDLPSDWGPQANKALCDIFFGSMKRVRKEHMGGKRCAGNQSSAFILTGRADLALVVLAILVTSPAYQGRGVGSLLCKEGLRAAAREGLPAWLEASAQGRTLYQKLGFEDVEDIVVDLGKYGGEGLNTTVCMVRKVDVDASTE